MRPSLGEWAVRMVLEGVREGVYSLQVGGDVCGGADAGSYSRDGPQVGSQEPGAGVCGVGGSPAAGRDRFGMRADLSGAWGNATSECAPSTYYAYKSRPPSAKAQRDGWLTVQIRRVHEENYGMCTARRRCGPG